MIKWSYPIIIVFVLAGYVQAYEASSLAVGFEGALQKNGVPQAWILTTRAGKADATAVTDSGGPILHVKCIESSFSLERQLMLATNDFHYLCWTWKAVKLPPSGDVRSKERNDQALQLLVAFENGKILSYVWDSNAPEGTVADESIGWPLNIAIKVIVVKTGADDAGKWITQTRNIYEDYRKFFNGPPAHVKGVRIQSNTQYTKGTAEGFVRNIVFSRSFQESAKN